MNINKLITKTNYSKGKNKKNKYIVIHYVGATGSAKNNCKYFEKTYRAASAHYFVGHVGEVWQCVEDDDIAWHCGAAVYKHPYCRNSNSIGIELCCKKSASGAWYFEEKTLAAAAQLTRELMDKYSISLGNVIRHYDVCGKICPEPFVRDFTAWQAFLSRLQNDVATANKSVVEIAKEVIVGKWGNGEKRKKLLAAAGYDYATVQRKVNELLK